MVIEIVAFRNKYPLSVVAAMCIVLGGCGDTGHAQDADMRLNVNHAALVAYGRMVNLRTSDVPRLVPARFPRSREAMSGPYGTYVEKCDGTSDGEVVGLASQRFRSVSNGNLIPRESAQSAVYVTGSSVLAHRDVMAAIGSHGQQCLKRSVLTKDPKVKPEGAKIGVPELSKVEVSAVEWHVMGAAVYSLRTTAYSPIETYGTVSAPNYYQDLVAFTVGRDVILLQTIGSPHPFPLVEERRLLSILYARAVSAKSQGLM